MNEDQNNQPSSQVPNDTQVPNDDAPNDGAPASAGLTEEQVQQMVSSAVSEATTKVREETTKDIVTRLTGEGDKQDDQNVPPWEKEGRKPKGWSEVVDYATKSALNQFESKQEAQKKAQETANRERELQQAQTLEQYNKVWDRQITSLEKDGHIPSIDKDIKAKLDKGEKLSDEEKQDPGIQARVKLYDLAEKHGTANLELVYYKYMSTGQADAPPPGANVPVQGNRKSVSSPGKGPGFSYEEIHNARDIRDLIN